MDSDNPRLIQLHQLRFHEYISSTAIAERIAEMGQSLHQKLRGENVVYLIMLKGAFVFAADLIRACGLAGEVDFVRTKSYQGISSSQAVEILISPDPSLVTGRAVVLVEDIIDSGLTMEAFLPKIRALNPKSITIVSLLHKPEAQKTDVAIDLVGFTIPDKFVVGYGLDYDGLGRELPGIYQVLDQI
ncbi:MAG: hypoxanthine phosphoribosyltransferase, partial [Bacteroidota bacterium]